MATWLADRRHYISFENAVDLRSKDVGTRGSEYKKGTISPGSLRTSEVGSIEIMPQVPWRIWPENMRILFLF
jgi:hypothetical protein